MSEHTEQVKEDEDLDIKHLVSIGNHLNQGFLAMLDYIYKLDKELKELKEVVENGKK